MRRVTFLTYSLDGHGGTQTYARTVTTSLSGRGIDTVFLDQSSVMDGVRGLRFPNYFLAPRLMKNLVTLVGDSEIVHANNVTPNITQPLLRFQRRTRIPVVFTAHELEYLAPRSNWDSLLPSTARPVSAIAIGSDTTLEHENPVSSRQGKSERLPATPLVRRVRDPFAHWAYSAFLRGVSSVISPTAWFASYLRDVVGKSTSIRHLYSPVGHPLWNICHSEIQRESTAEDSITQRKDVVFVGKLIEEKGASLLPRIAESLGEGTQLRIVGSGPLIELFSSISRGNLICLGSVDETIKMDTMRNAAVIICPSVYPEPGPSIILEAFALGKPVIAFNLGGQAELIRVSGCGLLAEPHDTKDFGRKTRQIIENPSLAREMGDRGKKFIIRNCGPRHYVDALLRLYDSVSA